MNNEFFQDYPTFYSTSTVGNWPARLNARYDAMIGNNADAFRNARVLDIASHDGRWSFAALKTGAKHVTGIEVRQEHIDAAHHNMMSLGIEPSCYTFKKGDIFDQTSVFSQAFDVVMCLGFLYHTTRHAELLDLIRQTNAHTVIIDTRILKGTDCIIKLRRDIVSRPEMGDSSKGVYNDRVLAAKPTKSALVMMLEHFGYAVNETDWADLIRKHSIRPQSNRPMGAKNPLRDYALGERSTFTAMLKDS